MGFNTSTAVFGAEFTVDTSIDQPSVLYWNQDYYYPLGFNFKLYNLFGQPLSMSAGDFSLDLSQKHYARFKILNQAFNGQTIIVQVTAKYI